jgi:hypothetical protein
MMQSLTGGACSPAPLALFLLGPASWAVAEPLPQQLHRDPLPRSGDETQPCRARE